MDKKTRPIYILSPTDMNQIERYAQTKSKGMEKYISWKLKGKKAGGAILISDKIDFKTQAVVRDTERHYTMLKARIQQEHINSINMYAPHIGAPNIF